MKNKIRYLITIFFCFSFFLHKHVMSQDMPQRAVEERKFEAVELDVRGKSTGGGLSFPEHIGWWLSNDLLLINALQDLPDANVKHLEKVVLVNAVTGKSKILIESARVVCWNEEKEVASIRPVQMGKGLRYLVKLDKQGNLSQFSGHANIDVNTCENNELNFPKSNAAVVKLLREQDGYIELSATGKSYVKSKMAILVRPDKSYKDIGVRAGEITRAIYFPYLNKYLLNIYDSQNDSDTDKRVAGRSWNRPYDLTPYRLMSPEGEITEIPYPKIIFEYGLKGFGYFYPLRDGVLIDNTGKGKGEHGMFLLQGDKLIRFWGGAGWFNAGRDELADGLIISPDGCKIAFRHGKNWTPDIQQKIMIINLCKGI